MDITENFHLVAREEKWIFWSHNAGVKLTPSVDHEVKICI